ALGVGAVRLPAPRGTTAGGGAAQAARLVLALGRLALGALPPPTLSRTMKKPARRGGAFVHHTYRPIRACARLSRSAGLRPTRAPRPAGVALYDPAAASRKGRARIFSCKERHSTAAATIAPMRGVLVLAVAALMLGASTAHAGARDLQHVTLIGDSVADAIPGDDQAVVILRQGVDLDLEVEPCRRVDQESCPNGNVRPPNVVQLAKSMGTKLGPNVVVSVGYNDFEDQYAQNIENALDAFKAAGVKHVWWLTLRAAHHPYI